MARLELLGGAISFRIGQGETLRVRIRNESTRSWRCDGENPIRLASHWRRSDGEMFVFEGFRTRLPHDLEPGAEVDVDCVVVAPNTAGEFRLELELVEEFVCWFGARGVSPLEVVVRVDGEAPGDFESYEEVWRRSDLELDWWSAVGPATNDEFLALGRTNLEMLRSQGLAPDSRLLDVGCGTGSLATSMEGFLDARGLYCGTDIGAEAIEFCRRRYLRPNFRFWKGTPKALEVPAGLEFDRVVFLSVLTHTFPEETVALLRDASRHLAPGGRILADVFLSEASQTWRGHRALVEMNESHFQSLLLASGLEGQVFRSLIWKAAGEEPIRRVYFRLSPVPAGTAVAGREFLGDEQG